MAKRKRTKGTNNDLQNITHENKDWVTRTPLKIGGELRCSVRVSISSSTSGTEMAIQNGLSRDTGNDWAQGTEQRQRMDYLEIQATIGHKAQNKDKQTKRQHRTKTISNTIPTEITGLNIGAREW